MLNSVQHLVLSGRLDPETILSQAQHKVQDDTFRESQICLSRILNTDLYHPHLQNSIRPSRLQEIDGLADRFFPSNEIENVSWFEDKFGSWVRNDFLSPSHSNEGRIDL